MSVYIAKAEQQNLVKIGASRNVDIRVRSVSYTCRLRLSVVRVIDGFLRTEREAHRRFEEFKIKGEWFNWSDTMLTEQFEPETPEEEYNQSIINRIFNDGIHPWMVAKELGVDQPAINRVLKAYGYGPPDFWNASRTPEALAERKLRWNSWRALTYRRKFKLWL